MDPIKGGIDSLAMAISLQGDLLMTLIDKSLPTLIGLAGEAPRRARLPENALVCFASSRLTA